MNLKCDKCGIKVRQGSGTAFNDIWCVVCAARPRTVVRHFYCCMDHAEHHFDPERIKVLALSRGEPE